MCIKTHTHTHTNTLTISQQHFATDDYTYTQFFFLINKLLKTGLSADDSFLLGGLRPHETNEIMVSFDVVSLFTKVPIKLALKIAKQRLQSDPELNQRTALSTTDLIKGLEICLNSANFTFRGKHYKQVFGTAMGFPVSSVVANLVMENIETRALETLADPPRLWKRYVDDIFVIMKRSKLSEFLTHLNTTESFIQFTMEKEK